MKSPWLHSMPIKASFMGTTGSRAHPAPEGIILLPVWISLVAAGFSMMMVQDYRAMVLYASQPHLKWAEFVAEPPMWVRGPNLGPWDSRMIIFGSNQFYILYNEYYIHIYSLYYIYILYILYIYIIYFIYIYIPYILYYIYIIYYTHNILYILYYIMYVYIHRSSYFRPISIWCQAVSHHLISGLSTSGEMQPLWCDAPGSRAERQGLAGRRRVVTTGAAVTHEWVTQP